MSKNKDEMRLENLGKQTTPLGVASVNDSEPSRKQTKAVNAVTGTDSHTNTKSDAERDAAQHMNKLMKCVLVFGAINTAKQHHRNKKYTKASKDFEKLQNAYNAARTSGSRGRSVEEILLEDRMKERKKQLEKMQKKWPNLQRPMSMSQKFQTMFRTSKQGISEALRAQTMKGVAQATSGSDVRAIMAANAGGYVPGTENQIDTEMTL